MDGKCNVTGAQRHTTTLVAQTLMLCPVAYHSITTDSHCALSCSPSKIQLGVLCVIITLLLIETMAKVICEH